MANVPDYTPQIGLQGPVRSEESIDVNPAAFGAGTARAAEGLGQTAEEAAYQVIDRSNYVKVEQARQQFMANVDEKAQSDWFTRKGLNAGNVPADANQFIAQQRQAALDTLDNGRQQNMFNLQTLRYARGQQNAADRWAREQLNFAAQAADAGGIKSSSLQMRMATTSELYDNARQDLDTYIDKSNEDAGRDPEAAKAFSFNAISNAHMGVVNSLRAADRLEDAATYLDKYQDEIDPAAHGQGALSRQLHSEAIYTQAQVAADDAFTKNFGENSGLNEKAAYATVNAIPGAVGKQATIQLKKRIDEYNASQKNDENLGQANLVKDAVANNKTFDDYSIGELYNFNPGTSFMKEQIDRRAALANRGAKVKDEPALDAEMNTLLSDIYKNRTADDPDHKIYQQLLARTMDLADSSSVRGAQALKLMDEWNNPDKGVSREMNEYLTQSTPAQRAAGKSGGLMGDVARDVAKANLDTATGYTAGQRFGIGMLTSPLIGANLAPRTEPAISSETRRLAYVKTIQTMLKQQIQAHPDWTPSDLQNYYDNDSTMQSMRSVVGLKAWAEGLKAPQTGAFKPSDIEAK